MSHELKMLLGCLLPILLIFILPLFGVSDTVAVFIFIVLMFACHLGMMGHHKHGSGHKHSTSDKGDRHHEQT